ncbi:MAG: RidA family protein [Proteobacteria bacterium]|nr:RidA family protein [Pseudomonadota bacterium]
MTEVSSVDAPEAIGPYSQAIRYDQSGHLLFLSGQVPIVPATGEIVPRDVTAQAHQVLKNLAAVLKAGGSSFEQVIKTTIFLTTMDHFTAVNQVYSQYFAKPYPVRATVAVKELPCGALVEIDAIAYAKNKG